MTTGLPPASLTVADTVVDAPIKFAVADEERARVSAGGCVHVKGTCMAVVPEIAMKVADTYPVTASVHAPDVFVVQLSELAPSVRLICAPDTALPLALVALSVTLSLWPDTALVIG